MTRSSTRHRARSRAKVLSMEQQQALGDLGLIGGPAFLIGLWGLASLISGTIAMINTLF